MTKSWTTDRWAAVELVFHAATLQPESGRAAFVRSTHAQDPELVAAVLRLLAADTAEADELLDRGAEGLLHGLDPLLGARFGPFRLLERIAEGGMGSVYRAERTLGDFEQDVAVKVLRLGLSTPSLRDRFVRERQTLARLVHPNVARLLDGGTNEQGVPFLAMERIDGLPIDRYCDAQQLPLRQRLALFVLVARAVHFAHQNLVVHLDLKPSNILVDMRGVPKLLDFGVAGFLEEASGAAGSVTATRSRPLTPEYASPEQLRGEPMSTAADVYALGVVLYELLTGGRPFGRGGTSDLDLLHAVCDTEALRPSASCSMERNPTGTTCQERAARRGLAPTALARSLRGDLDRIVLMALRKEPARRYGSCEEFAEDVERFLGGFPVVAREARFGYRFGRFVARNRMAVGAGALVVVALLGGLLATLQMAKVASHERDVANAARSQAEHEQVHARIEADSSGIVAAMLSDTFLSADFVGTPEQRSKLQLVLQGRAAQVRRQHDGAAALHLRANLLDALGRACLAIDAFADAEALLTEAMDLRVQHFGNDSLERALSLTSLGRLYYQQGRFADAVTALQECYRLHQVCAPGVHTDVAMAANDLAAAERANGNRDRARALHEEALRLRRGSNGAATVAVAESLNNLASVDSDLGTAAGHLREALTIRDQLLGPDDPLTIQSRINLARLCIGRNDLAAAEPLLRAAVLALRGLAGRGNDGLGQALGSLAYCELRLQRPAAARACIDEALALERQRFGDVHPRVASALEILASVREASDERVAAIEDWREALRIRRLVYPAGHRDIAKTLTSLGTALSALDAAAAIPLFEEAAASHAAAKPPRTTDLAEVRIGLAGALERAGQADAAERTLLVVLADSEADAAPRSRVMGLQRLLAEFYLRTGRPTDAARYQALASERKE